MNVCIDLYEKNTYFRNYSVLRHAHPFVKKIRNGEWLTHVQ